MKLDSCARFLVLVALALPVHASAQAQPTFENRASSSELRTSELPPLRRCGLIHEDPRTIPWMVQDKLTSGVPRRLGVSVDLSDQMPPVGDQKQQGSCAAWAIGYYQKTHYEWIEHEWNLNQTDHQFSPAFIYNQINGGADSGSGYSDAFALIADQGCGTMADCPYDQNDYTSWPSESAYARAIPYRGGSSHWFWMQDTAGINQAKQRLDSGYTTVIGINIYSNFDNIDSFDYTYCVADTYGGNRGGHAVTIIGYNDTMTTNDGTGAFKMINSWGTGWGQSGYWWMSYVAAKDPALSAQVGFYLDDLIGYSPTMLGRVKITHPARDKIGIRLGVGRPSSPNWMKNFRTWRQPKIDRAFPGHNIVFDMTEGEPYITNETTDTVFVRAIDDVSDSKTGTIDYFAATHLAWNVTGVSSDTPVSIPDYNVGVYARAVVQQTLDVGVTQIVAPTGTVDSGATIAPQARVKNFGTSTVSFPVTFRIGSFYNNSQSVSSLAPGDSVLVSFTNWTALQRGTHVTRCTTALTGDQDHDNDTLSGSVAVRVTNVGVTAIVAPPGTVDSGTTIIPQARVRNSGTDSASFPVTFRIGSFYNNSQDVSNLAPGDSVLVSFTNWTALQRGTHVKRCSTALAGDQVHTDDTLSGTVLVRVIDVGVTAIVAPPDTVDSGVTVAPQARVKNYGTGAATFPVTLRIGSDYTNTQTVTDLAAGDSAVVSFTTWTALQCGTFVKRCTTALPGDVIPANDTLSGTVTVIPLPVVDVGVTAIVAPTGTVDSGTTITPRARVKNFGNTTASFPATFRIGSFYDNTQDVSDLAPGDSVLVSFADWTALQRGTHVTRCTTALTGDQDHSNDALSGSVTVRVTNVGVTAIVAPTGTVDSGATITPQARVRNYGTDAVSFPAFFRIGSFYNNSQNVSDLAPGDSVLVSFTNWTALQRGTHVTRCSTALTGDQDYTNDTLAGSVTVRVTDVGVTALVAPPDTVDSGATITPQARVKNFGNTTASFPATFRIGSFYDNTRDVSDLAAGDSVLVSFATWTALQVGTFVKRCSTALAGDQVHANDTLSGLVTVLPAPVIDVGVTAIVAPTGTVDSGTTVAPQARVKNYGNSAASFPVTFRIGSFYNNSQNVTNLAPGDSIQVSFADWTASQRGIHVTRCSTALSGDQNHDNDTLSGSVTVRVTNVGVTAIVAPTGTVDSGTTVTPRARVKNYGTSIVSFPVTFRIGSFYNNSQTVTNLAPGDSVLISFANWTALQRGTHTTRCSTALVGDQVHADDTLSGSVTVRVTNVGVTAIVAPPGTVDSGATITPQARVKNFGNTTASFPATFRIGSFYDNSQNVLNLAPGDSVLVSFADWTALQRGTHVKRCSTALAGDQVHTNDTLSGTVLVRVVDVGVTAIAAPPDTVDSGATVAPQARVRNYGTGVATFPVTFRIGSDYTNTQTVTNLAAGDSVQVSFANWTALQCGTFVKRCTTVLSNDVIPANDTLSGTVTVIPLPVVDVGVTQIVAPTGTVDSGTTIIPQARVKNYGNSAASFPVTFRIGSSYSNTQTVTSLAAGDSVLVSFTNWTALQRGTHVTRCTTALTGDQNHANDALSGSVTVRVTNVGVTAIVAPTGTVDSGATITPQARVRNYGTSAATFSVTMSIDTGYANARTIGRFAARLPASMSVGRTFSDVRTLGTNVASSPKATSFSPDYNNTQTVTDLAPGDSVLVSFSPWTAGQRGTHVTRCSTALANDQVHTNDTLSGSVTVRVADVGATAIVAPTDTVDSGAAVTPQARVRNYGTSAASFPVTFSIGTLYSDLQNVNNLAVGDSALVTFASWTATARGSNVTRCSTALGGDNNHVNDTVRGSVAVRVRDIACTQLLAPPDTVDSGATVVPRAVVTNVGTTSETFDARFTIGADYADTVSLTLAAGATDTIDFAGWIGLALGTFPTCCATMLPTDVNPANDSLPDSVIVVTYTGVAERQVLPTVLGLERPAPDPMRGNATIRFSIPRRTHASLTLRSVTGALVRTFSAPRSLAPGSYSLTWDGRDDRGRSVAPGIYFWRLESGGTALTRKAVKID